VDHGQDLGDDLAGLACQRRCCHGFFLPGQGRSGSVDPL
jgi:hypothetical protein